MAIFVDEQTNQDGQVIRRMMMSNISVSELTTEASRLGLPIVASFPTNRLPHYFLTAAQRSNSVENGAEELTWKSEEWRTIHSAAVKLPR